MNEVELTTDIGESVKEQITQDSLDKSVKLSPLQLADLLYTTAQQNPNVQAATGAWAITALSIVLTQLSASYSLKGYWISSGTTINSDFYISPEKNEKFLKFTFFFFYEPIFIFFF